MNRTARFFLILAGVLIVFLLAGSASANTATVRCVSQQDQISVYNSLSSRGVETKLKCGEEVEIIGRVQDYVRIRAHNGVEGYVHVSLFAALPSIENPKDPAANVESASAVQAQNTNDKKQNSGEPVAPSATFAEMNPVTAPAPLAEPAAKPAAGGTAASAVKPKLDDPNDIPAVQPENESADPACQNYFSAYGLAPSQMKWIAQNRKKLFANVCPAPDVSKVDFVIIFTHDVDFFSATMPTPVHLAEGFSDFTALTPEDTELMSVSDADRAHHQYVWIFHFAPGTFDPANFSPRRRYQFAKVESNALGSKAGLKTVEDAFRFIARAARAPTVP
ncbi:MAG: SH3 domain-containing protein [Candidatus Acidiferrales bacterium]